MSTLTDDYGAEFVAVTAWPTEPLASTSSCGPSCLRRFAQVRSASALHCLPLPSRRPRRPWIRLACSIPGRAEQSIPRPREGSTDRFDTRALKRRF